MVRLSLYQKLAEITDQYTGLGHSFLDELIEYRLKIEPVSLSKREYIKIRPWVEILASLMISRQSDLKAYLKELAKLEEKANGQK